MNISLAISQLFPEADPLTDFLVSDQGDGQFIADWNLPDPQPTEDELRVAWEAHLNKPVPEGLYVPKWDGSKWVEGADDAYKKTVDTIGSALTDIEVLQEENAELKTRLASTEAAILSLMDYV